MIFRWLALGLLLRRSSDQPLKCAFSCALLFGLFHLLNFSGTRFSATYIAMQIGFGIQVGFFYAMYMLMSGSVSMHFDACVEQCYGFTAPYSNRHGFDYTASV